MFDTSKIGKYISFLRKNNGMTQGQLAEKLGVSHQAVSNWERGEAMPDIALITKLARVLNTTSDRILLSGEDTETVDYNQIPASDTSLKSGEPVIKINNSVSSYEFGENNKKQYNEDSVESETLISEKVNRINELKSTIAVLKERISNEKLQSVIEKLEELIDEVQEQIDGLNEEIEELQEGHDEEELETAIFDKIQGLPGLEHLESLKHSINFKWIGAPEFGYKSKSKIKESMISSSKDESGSDNTDIINWNNIMSIAPFASRETLDKLIERLQVKADFNKIMSLAPFLSAQTIEKLVLTAFDEGEDTDWNIVINLAPFTSSGTLDILVSKLNEKAEFEKIAQLAPFISSQTIEKMVIEAYDNGDIVSWQIITSLAPFATKNTLDLLISKIDMKKDFNRLMELAPFLSRETIDKLINSNL